MIAFLTLTMSGPPRSMLITASLSQVLSTSGSLDCVGDPELVVAGNQSGDSIDLAGGTPQSHPVDPQVFDLGIVGAMEPLEKVTIESGPPATGVFVWSRDFILRSSWLADQGVRAPAGVAGTIVDRLRAKSLVRRVLYWTSS